MQPAREPCTDSERRSWNWSLERMDSAADESTVIRHASLAAGTRRRGGLFDACRADVSGPLHGIQEVDGSIPFSSTKSQTFRLRTVNRHAAEARRLPGARFIPTTTRRTSELRYSILVYLHRSLQTTVRRERWLTLLLTCLRKDPLRTALFPSPPPRSAL